MVEVNRRLVYAMRQVGGGHAEATKFMSLMNLPPPPNKKAYGEHVIVPRNIVKELAEGSMVVAAGEVKSLKNSTDCGVFIDGSWQHRGHSSLAGVVTAMSPDDGKVIDVHILNKMFFVP